MQATGSNDGTTLWSYSAGLEKEAETFNFKNNKKLF